MANEFLFGLAVGNAQRANDVEESAWIAVGRANRAEAHIGVLNAEIAALKRQAQVDEAAIVGHIAQINALKTAHPASPLLAHSGKRFKDGDPKSKLRLVFEQTFDAALRKISVTSPGSFRED